MLKKRHGAISVYVYEPLGQRPALRFGKRWAGLMSASKSRLAAETSAQELHCLNRTGSMLNITSQWKDTEILSFFFCYKSILQKSHMLKPLVPKLRPNLLVRLNYRISPKSRSPRS